ncbi:hypothetical protein BRYFOR_05102 [Marvinbryantia formatexigens DSM 14469]|uniref:Uncharacterized protein n=1 Tax=Marvinbryantia formatexigens DSM 14469 TaxID=478749 RepID=C6L912_9FIRM|nr:hypothetical protein BRYFOR_05102 [Marvinbryantia formatexigens DSM 14469]
MAIKNCPSFPPAPAGADWWEHLRTVYHKKRKITMKLSNIAGNKL